MSERTMQVLSLHRITPRCYDLTNVRTGSVRDQLIRATLLADALHESKLVGDKDPLLVLGAGVAGVALGLAAADRGVDVTIVEKTNDPLGTLRSCFWRIVDPTEYDWPHEHWNTGKLPLVAPGSSTPAPILGRTPPVQIKLPLPPGRMDGAALAAVWSRLHGHVLFPKSRGSTIAVGAGSVTILYGKNADDLTIDDSAAATVVAKRTPGNAMWRRSAVAASSRTRVTASWPGWQIPKQFGAVVSCIGFGEEITDERPIPMPGTTPNWSGFTGHRFWFDHDQMFSWGFTPANTGAIPSAILISGAGDGAMQDFQRAATGLFGRGLFEKIDVAASQANISFSPASSMKDALLAEDAARRSHGWRPEGFLIEQALLSWENAYKKVVWDLWSGWQTAEQKAIASAVLRPEVLAFLENSAGRRTRVLWMIRESTPGFTYGLNRFLSLLVVELMKIVADGNIVGTSFGRLESYEIGTITPDPTTSHSCGNPAGCYARMHHVELNPVGEPPGRPVLQEDFDLILVRHGQETSPLLGGASVPEQQVPFDLPH
jgi:hypothetical protein